MKKIAIYCLKISFTLFFIWYFLQKIDLRSALDAIQGSSPFLFLLALGFVAVSWIFTALRWRTILSSIGINVTGVRLFVYNLIGNFYGIILPGGKVTGDLMSAYRLTNGESGNYYRTKYFLSMLADRFLGMFIMVIILSFYFVFSSPVISVFGNNALFLGAVFVGGVLGVCAAIFIPALDALWHALSKIPILFFEKIFNKALAILQFIRSNKKSFLVACALSFVATLLNITAIYLLATSVHLELDILTVGFAYLAATTLVSIPVTLAGIGLREGTLVYILTAAGGELHASAALSLLALALLAVYGVIGGIIEIYFLFQKKNQSIAAK
jgi:uncharacterized protein (TIRG00374 family)